eukprot:COSAG04_NODE_3753_length_2558_cov_3.102074_2_plen_75_part_00
MPPLQDFGNYVMTFPNYYVVGPNVAFFAQHGVKGIFEEGPPSDIGDGTDMEESAPPPPPCLSLVEGAATVPGSL